MASSKKGISSNQLHRTLGVTLKTAWFMSHRVREAMKVLGMTPMGGAGMTVEIDETASGRSRRRAQAKYPSSGRRPTWSHRFDLSGARWLGPQLPRRRHDIAQLIPIIRANVAKESAVMTTRQAGTNT